MNNPILTKVCNRCGEEKALTEFYKDKRSKDGLTTICKKCIRVNAERYKKSEKGKKSEKRYRQGEAGKKSRKRYKKGEAGKKAGKRYREGEIGKLSREDYSNRIRLEVLRHYSEEIPRCKKCGENHLEFLEIDHINGGGRKQRRESGCMNIYLKLRRENFPEGYQVLCSNCNIKKLKMFNNSKFINTIKQYKIDRKSRDKFKVEVFSHYTTDGKIKCSCPGCIVDDIDVLCIDHINGDGAEHRKNNGLKGGIDMYRWIRKNNYPKDLRLLCCNCNQVLNNYGYCPHNI
jgi:hypothetical protein